MRRKLGLGALALAIGSMLGATPEARAQGSDDERARIHFMAGSNYYDEGQYESAAGEFMEAYRLSHRPQLLLNASTAYERALMFDDAIAALQSYLEATPADAPDRATHERKVQSLQELRDRYQAQQQAAQQAVSPTPEQAAQQATTQTEPEEESGGMDGLQLSGLVTGSAGVALEVVALVTGIVANNQRDDLAAICGPGGASCPPGSQGDIDRANALAKTSTATFFVGLAAIGAGVTLFVLGGDDESESEVAITTGPGNVGVGTRWSF